MSYIALYRKYRPKIFKDVYGQDAIVQTLKNQVKNNRISNAYLFSGPRGTGKTSIAKIMAKAATCLTPNDGEPCGSCISCKTKTSFDIQELDAASNNGVDNIRNIIDTVQYKPQEGLRKVYIIDEVHMLSTSAFNALLKTLEEPPEDVVFILATTEKDKVLPTILSRCQQFDFHLLTDNQIINALKEVCIKENITWKEETSFEYIAKLAKGSLRDAYSILDTLSVQNGTVPSMEKIYEIFGIVSEEAAEELARKIQDKKVEEMLSYINMLEYQGKTLEQICNGLYNYYRKCFMDHPEIAFHSRCMRIIGELLEKVKHGVSKAYFEITMVKLCTPQMEIDYESLLERIRILERKLLNEPEKLPENIITFTKRKRKIKIIKEISL